MTISKQLPGLTKTIITEVELWAPRWYFLGMSFDASTDKYNFTELSYPFILVSSNVIWVIVITSWIPHVSSVPLEAAGSQELILSGLRNEPTN